MKIEVNNSLVMGIAAYLRQLELSVHRVDSARQLEDFLREKSILPSVALKLLRGIHPKHIPPSEHDWIELSKSSDSVSRMMRLKLKAWFSKSSTVMIKDTEVSASIEIFQAIERMLDSDDMEITARNEIRYKLHTCAEVWQMLIFPTASRRKVRSVEHVNSASHLKTFPISDIADWL